jgi:hypothetical protein
MKWYLDAWDSRGGRAFASQRAAIESNARTKEQLKLGQTASIYVGPPGFQPEPIANAAIGYSAGRGGVFGQRVPREGPEVGFPAAQAVAEFVRRGFIAGGGARGGGDGGTPGPAQGPEAPPKTPDEGKADASSREERLRVVAALAGDFKKSAERLSKLNLDSDMGTSNKQARTIADRAFRLPDNFVLEGGVQLISTMLYAHPDPPANVAHQKSWGRAARSMHQALGELELWADLAGDPTGQKAGLLDYLAQSLRTLFHKKGWSRAWPQGPSGSAALAIASTILSQDPELSNDRHFYHWLHYYLDGHPIGYPYHRRYVVEGQQDRFEPMFFWPLPPYVRYSFPGLKSLGQLLSKYVSSPIEFADKGAEVLQLVAFGAAFLGSRIEDRLMDDWQNRAAISWLGRSIPRWIFSTRVEGIIRDVGRLHEPVTDSA